MYGYYYIYYLLLRQSGIEIYMLLLRFVVVKDQNNDSNVELWRNFLFCLTGVLRQHVSLQYGNDLIWRLVLIELFTHYDNSYVHFHLWSRKLSNSWLVTTLPGFLTNLKRVYINYIEHKQD